MIAHPPKRRIAALNTDTSPHRSLADKHPFAGARAACWSQAIADRYHLRLSVELADWFDSGVCECLGLGEFCEPADPEQLLAEAPECIWPGLMPPDVLPLVGNGIGDWLCGRVSASGTIDEVIYWYHGGGDYLPYGTRLAEAILFDNLADRLPGRRQLHAIPAEREKFEHQGVISGPLVTWALRHLPSEVAGVLTIDAPPSLVADELRRHKIALDAVRCDAVLAALDSELRVRLSTADALKLGVSWDRDIAMWMFDTSTIPASTLAMLNKTWGSPTEQSFEQDWQSVERICSELAHERNDLGWVHDCLGWAAQRRGDLGRAIEQYEISALTSVFTDQTIRFRTHFDCDRIAKFSVARLLEIGCDHGVDPQYIDALCQTDQMNWRNRVSAYWFDQAIASGLTHEQQYQTFYRAGWDVGCDSMRRYRDVLDHLACAATRAGQPARAEVARTHAACIDNRYLRHKR